MYRTVSLLGSSLAVTLASCSSGGGTMPNSPTVSSAASSSSSLQQVPRKGVLRIVTTVPGFHVKIFATPPKGSTNPDSLVQIGRDVFVGFGDDVGPGGSPGPDGKTSVEIVRYGFNGKLKHIYEVPGHNDGLMAFNSNTLWALSNEDANAMLTVININTGAETLYKPQASLVNPSGGLPHGGGLDDMQMIADKVYASASNPTVSTTTPCPANSSTPGCPNGINTGPIVYVLTLNGDGKTFDLTPLASSEVPATNIHTGVTGTLNATDPDSEEVAPGCSTLVVDSQQDAELVFITNLGSSPSLSYLPLTLNGSPQQVDDTRFAPFNSKIAILADTPANVIYRIDGNFKPGDAYSSGETALLKLNTKSGVMTAIASGFQAPHGLLFLKP